MFKTTLLALILAGPAAAAEPELGVFALGSARFTVVAPECVRIEYSTAGRFLDAPTDFARDRGARFTGYSVELSTSRLVLDTGRLRLSYVPDGWPLSVANLKAELRIPPATQVWTPERDREPLLEGGFGVLSRAGWRLVDDSSGGRTDWYLFAYGRDYKAGLRALAALKGGAPAPAASLPGGLRERLSPYLLASARESREQGLPLRRPLYLEHPQEDEAYRHPQEAFIGDSLLEVPSGQAGWLPAGAWFDLASGEGFQGPADLSAAQAGGPARVFAKGGAPLAIRPRGKAPAAVVLRAYPGPDGVTSWARLDEKGAPAAELSCLRQGERTRLMLAPLSGRELRPRPFVVELGGPRAERAQLDGKDAAVAYDAKAKLSRVRVPARGAWTLYVWQ